MLYFYHTMHWLEKQEKMSKVHKNTEYIMQNIMDK